MNKDDLATKLNELINDRDETIRQANEQAAALENLIQQINARIIFLNGKIQAYQELEGEWEGERKETE